MSNKKSLILSLMLVLIVGLSIVAGTFAYFQWQAATGTQVNVTIEMGNQDAHRTGSNWFCGTVSNYSL